MAVPKTKETPEVKTEEPETKPQGEEMIKKSDLLEAVREVVKEIFPGKSGETETKADDETGTPAKRMTARDEEEHTRGIVAQAIEDFLAKAPTEKKEEKEVKAEAVPGARTVRKVEGFLWGKD